MLDTMRAWPRLAHRYAIPDLFEIPSGVDIKLLETSLRAVWSRHEALRARFVSEDGHLLVAHDREVAPLHVGGEVDSSRLADELRFDLDDVLSGQPLAQHAIVERDHRKFLVLRVHHLVVDGWSRTVLWNDLDHAYRSGGSLPARPRFSDFAREQHERWTCDSAAATAAWKEAFGATYQSLPWPAPTMRSAGGAAIAAVSSSALGIEESARLREHAKAARVSASTALSFAIGLAMSTWAGVPVLIGSDSANREDRRWRELVGQVVSTQYVAVDAAAASYSLESALALGTDQLRLARRFRGMCFEQLHRAVGAPPHLKVNNFSPDGPEGGAAGALGLTEVEIERGAPRVRHPWSLMTIAEDDLVLHQIRRADLVDGGFSKTFPEMLRRAVR